VVIEGVETEEQRALLRLAGCSEMQGYLFARPGPREHIDALLLKPLRARSG
jgi:EAL domain-containing protein (putative c-di-GMP-specific phosphodiesterase class I)